MTLTLSGEASPGRNVYRIITDQVMRQLEHGVAPWRKPWRAELPLNLISGKPYRGINVFLLASQGYGSRYWLTFNQAAKLGGRIAKGSTLPSSRSGTWAKRKPSEMETGTSVNRGHSC